MVTVPAGEDITSLGEYPDAVCKKLAENMMGGADLVKDDKPYRLVCEEDSLWM